MVIYFFIKKMESVLNKPIAKLKKRKESRVLSSLSSEGSKSKKTHNSCELIKFGPYEANKEELITTLERNLSSSSSEHGNWDIDRVIDLVKGL